MPSLAHLFAPLALLLVPAAPAPALLAESTPGAASPFDPDDAPDEAWSLALRVDGPPLAEADTAQPGVLDPDTWNQVRIEQHLIIRIAPGPAPRGAFFATPPPVPPQRVPRRELKCVAMAGLAGVRLSGANQLTLLLRDERVVQATLPKICAASAFYSGFYVEPTGDGMLCARRDVIHSRAGANCSISKLMLAE